MKKTTLIIAVSALLALASCSGGSERISQALSEQSSNHGSETSSDEAKEFTVRFLNWDESFLMLKKAVRGSKVVYDGPEPKRKSGAEFSYSFSGWSDEGALSNVQSDLTETAVFSEKANQYDVTFKDGDDTMKKTTVPYGTLLSGIAPEGPASRYEDRYYGTWITWRETFVGWDIDGDGKVDDISKTKVTGDIIASACMSKDSQTRTKFRKTRKTSVEDGTSTDELMGFYVPAMNFSIEASGDESGSSPDGSSASETMSFSDAAIKTLSVGLNGTDAESGDSLLFGGAGTINATFGREYSVLSDSSSEFKETSFLMGLSGSTSPTTLSGSTIEAGTMAAVDSSDGISFNAGVGVSAEGVITFDLEAQGELFGESADGLTEYHSTLSLSVKSEGTKAASDLSSSVSFGKGTAVNGNYSTNKLGYSLKLIMNVTATPIGGGTTASYQDVIEGNDDMTFSVSESTAISSYGPGGSGTQWSGMSNLKTSFLIGA